MNSKPMATKVTQKQLAALAYWQGHGYKIGRDEMAPENTVTPPNSACKPSALELVVSFVLASAACGWAYYDSIAKGLL